MRYANKKKILTVMYKNKYKYYGVCRFLEEKEDTKLFPYTPEGYKEAIALLKEYIVKKEKEFSKRRKNKLKGLIETKKYQSGELKHMYFCYNRRLNVCVLSTVLNEKKKSLTINHRGFNKVFDMQIELYRKAFMMNMNDEEIKSRIEKTRKSLLKKYVECCKENKLTINH